MAIVTIIHFVLIVGGFVLAVMRGPSASGGSGPRCGSCGYDLTGSESNRCPECGKLFIEAGVLVASGTEGARRWRVLLGLAAVAIVAMFGTAVAMIHLAERAATRAARAQKAAAQARAAATNSFLQQTLAAASQPAAATSQPVPASQAAEK